MKLLGNHHGSSEGRRIVFYMFLLKILELKATITIKALSLVMVKVLYLILEYQLIKIIRLKIYKSTS